MNARPTIKNKSPVKNCTKREGSGGCKIPKTVSLIHLIPSAAKKPGMSKMIKAIIRCIRKILSEVSDSIINVFNYLSRREKNAMMKLSAKNCKQMGDGEKR
jgi:hypothetical protein